MKEKIQKDINKNIKQKLTIDACKEMARFIFRANSSLYKVLMESTESILPDSKAKHFQLKRSATFMFEISFKNDSTKMSVLVESDPRLKRVQE